MITQPSAKMPRSMHKIKSDCQTVEGMRLKACGGGISAEMRLVAAATKAAVAAVRAAAVAGSGWPRRRRRCGWIGCVKTNR